MTHKSTLSLVLGLVALFAILFTGTAHADVYVIESSVPTVAVGARLAMDDTVAIPSGGVIRAVLPSGKTQTIRGPFNGKVADLTKGTAQNEGLMAWVKKMMETGGATEKTMGATRSVSRVAGKPRGFSWVEVPVGVSGNICLQNGSGVDLSRASTGRRDFGTLVDKATGARADVVWDANSQTTEWPKSLPIKADGAYELIQQDRPKREFTVRLVDKVPAEGDELTELYRLGCEHQFAAWLRDRKLAAAGKS